MFSLIVTIIAIALVAALAIATIYYGGSSFLQGKARADAATFVNAAQQLSGANSLYANTEGGTFADNTSVLVSEHYIKAEPDISINGWSLVGVAVEGDAPNAEVCAEINKLAGISALDTPEEVDAAPANWADLTDGAPYACVVPDDLAPTPEYLFMYHES